MNALTDVEWVKTTSGNLTVRETLERASDITFLRPGGPSYVMSGTLRLLEHVFALSVRHGSLRDLRNGKPISTQAIDAALADIGAAGSLHDAVMPFLQRPVLPVNNTNDLARAISPGNQPVKKLSPSMPPGQAETFWNLGSHQPEYLETADAVRALVVFTFYSPAGNNSYAGDKCTMGSPALRFLDEDNSATEVFWQGPNLLSTLAKNTPRAWIDGTGLPAWADRTGARSFQDGGTLHPLWRASWASNAPACLWEGDRLVAVRIGGVPPEWFHSTMGIKKADRKTWWDERNIEDPHYLYMPDQRHKMKAKRLDLGRDATALAVEWNAEGNGRALRVRAANHAYAPENDDNLVFFRHQIGGKAASPAIRASEWFAGGSNVWAPNDEVADVVKDWAETMLELQRTVAGPFPPKGAGDRKTVVTGRIPPVFENLEPRRTDAIAYFWREMSEVFEEAMCSLGAHRELSTQTWKSIHDAALRAFDAAVAPFLGQLGPQAAYVRGQVDYRVWRIINKNGE